VLAVERPSLGTVVEAILFLGWDLTLAQAMEQILEALADHLLVILLQVLNLNLQATQKQIQQRLQKELLLV
ncbi:MAG: hypothetical protein KAJ19_29450, partial [Gammaproteobacteria bacterium]|nr:hypothetical protein [Gammaproteobacteria bacterium]